MHDMLNFALDYHIVYYEIMGEWDMKLCQYELLETEWTIVEQLWDVLKVSSTFFATMPCFYCSYIQVFKDATLFFSCVTPNLASVLPAMDHINNELKSDALNQEFKRPI